MGDLHGMHGDFVRHGSRVLCIVCGGLGFGWLLALVVVVVMMVVVVSILLPVGEA